MENLLVEEVALEAPLAGLRAVPAPKRSLDWMAPLSRLVTEIERVQNPEGTRDEDEAFSYD